MKNKSKPIEENNTFDILDEIQEVKVNPFFKNKVLNAIREQKEDQVPLFGWFSPQLQLATLALILCINALAIIYSLQGTETNQELSGIEAFVQDYSILDSDTTISIN
jgi:hypothetical protein